MSKHLRGKDRRSSSRARRIREFKDKLSELGYSSYSEYLKSSHWQDVKRRFWASKLSKNKCCSGCGSKGKLSLHHKTYKRIGAEWLGDLVQVCDSCHDKIHTFEEETSFHIFGATKGVLRKVRRENGLTFEDVR